MNGITIYLEGGGDGTNTKAALRRGMDAFLGPIKQQASAKSLAWKLVLCGSRRPTFKRFRDAVTGTQPDELVVLLVDAEAAVGNNTPRAHLQTLDKWDLAFADDDMVHLMVQVMEAWIVADPETLAEYYGPGFDENAFTPDETANPETIPKGRIGIALKRATRGTQKGAYHKIRHASEILQRLDHQRVRQRCPACNRLFDTLERRIAAA